MTDQPTDWDEFQRFTTYEQYFDAVVDKSERDKDLFYLEDELAARDVELGRRVDAGFLQSQNILQPHEFEKAHQDLKYRREKDARFISRSENGRFSCQESKSGEVYHFTKNNPVLSALADREKNHRLGILNSVVYLRYKNRKNQEVSGYFDFADRLKNELGFDRYFSGKKLLTVTRKDLSYYNWNTLANYSNESEKFWYIQERNYK